MTIWNDYALSSPEVSGWYLVLLDEPDMNYEILEWFDEWLDHLDRPVKNVNYWAELPRRPRA